MTRLTPTEITARLELLPGWRLENDTLRKTFAFADFVSAMHFVNAVADAAQKADHHPDIDIRYSKVTLGFSTHDAGGITQNDFDGAHIANDLA